MNNRQVLQYKEKVAAALILSLEIQNKGIGTSFFNIDAHIARINIQVHLSSWAWNTAGPSTIFQCNIGDNSQESEIDGMIKEMIDFISHHSE